MGSCYSTKASQMPLPTQPSPSGSLHSTAASRKPNPGSLQKSRGFGFNHGKHSKPQQASLNSSEISSCKANGDPVKVIPGKTQKVASSPQSRFGFKKPGGSAGKGLKKDSRNDNSDKVKGSKLSGSVDSLTSASSKVGQKGSGLRGPAKTSAKTLTFTHKPSSYRPNDNAEWKMIDESESSHTDNASADILSSEMEGKANTEDAANANIPGAVLDNKRNRDSSDSQSAPTKTDASALRNDVNGNKRDTHSKTCKEKRETSESSRLQSKLKKPFVKSKTFSDAHGLKKEEVVLKNARNSVEHIEKTGKGKSMAPSKTSFLKRGFFGRQKNSVPAGAAEKSSHKSDDTQKPVKEAADGGTNTSVEEVPEGKEARSKAGTVEIGQNSSSIVDSESSSETIKHSESSASGSQDPPTVCSSIPESLKARLGQADLPKGIAPIAILDSAETTSIGSINSDDLMLEMEIDLGEYEDEPQDELSGSRTSHSLIMRTKSTGSSHHPRSRSNSHGAGEKSTKGAIIKEDRTGSTSHVTGGEKEPGIVGNARYGRAPRTAMSPGGLEKREQWYNKKNKGSVSREDAMESVTELHSLMAQPKAQTNLTRRFPRTEGKAVRPASFPNFSRHRADSAPAQTEADGGNSREIPTEEIAPHPQKAHMFRPPRLPSLTDEDKVTVDGFTYRQMSQDITALKTMLLRLKRVIQDDELGSPIGPPSWKNGLSLGSSQPGSPFARAGDRGFSFCDVNKEKDTERSLQTVLKENEALKNQVEALRQKVEEQDRTIHLLQQQMTKYEQLGAAATLPATSHREKEQEEAKPMPKAPILASASKGKTLPSSPEQMRSAGAQTARRSLDYQQHKGAKVQPTGPSDLPQGHRPPRPQASTTIPECSYSGNQYVTSLLADMDHQIQSDMDTLFQNILESSPHKKEKPTLSKYDDAFKQNPSGQLTAEIQEAGDHIYTEEIQKLERKSEDTGEGGYSNRVVVMETEREKEDNTTKMDRRKDELLPEKKTWNHRSEREMVQQAIRITGNDGEDCGQRVVVVNGGGDLLDGFEKDSCENIQATGSFNDGQIDKKGKSLPSKTTSSNPRQSALPKYVPKGKNESSPKGQSSKFFKFGSLKKAFRSPIKVKSYSEA